jgi:DNA topoisomerase-1
MHRLWVDFCSIRRASLERANADEMRGDIDALTHVSDEDEGLTRHVQGDGFTYKSAAGRPVKDRAVLARIASLAIPPAWTDVWISPDAMGHIQATGRDQRGRKQYRYHADWTACRDEAKFGSLAEFARALPLLRERVDADLSRRALDKTRVSAAIVWLLDHTMIRVGNSAYAKENKSFGLTTLRDKHVSISGAKLRFEFRGKSGKYWQLGLVDRRIARIVKSVQEIPGQHLFQYFDEDGARHAIRSQDVNAYIRDVVGEGFSSKHFRTWGGTVRALDLFSSVSPPETKTGRARLANELIDNVASKLGNTRAVCRRCYIHPQVLASWEDDSLVSEVKRAARRKAPDGLDAQETLTAAWLTIHT